MKCIGFCEYYQTFNTFAPNRTYKTHKRCSLCDHIVDRKEFPDERCYCCNAMYKVRFRSSFKTRQLIRKRKKARQKLEILNVTIT